MKSSVSLLILFLLLTSCSVPEVANKPDVANIEGLWKSLLVTTEACGEKYINNNTEVTFDFSQQGTSLNATAIMKSEVVGGTSVHGGTFRGTLSPSGRMDGVWTIEEAPAGDVPEPPYDISINFQLSGTLLEGSLLHKGGAYCLGGRWEDASGTIVLKKQ